MTTVYLALGANLGNREKNLNQALDHLGKDVQITRVSSMYETEPWGVRDQPWFLNLVCKGETALEAVALLHRIKAIEKEMGRTQGIRFGPRPIDIDILFYDELVESTPDLTIPHPRLQERAFVLVPLAEIAPEWIHPQLRLTVRELLVRLNSNVQVHPYRPLV